MSAGGAGLRLDYRPPGPVAARFMKSSSGRGGAEALNGPIGSGKTSAILMKHVFRAQLQAASPIDGVRRYKFCVVRDTYRQLWETTIASWTEWIPKEVGRWTGSPGTPATHVLRWALPDGTEVELIAEFVAIGEHRAEDVLRGYQVTSFYLNEADLLAEEVFIYAGGRVGRYPAVRHGGATWYGLTLDFNAPDVDSWVYGTFYDAGLPEGWVFERQPGAVYPDGAGGWLVNPEAENLANLTEGYYDNQVRGRPDWYIRRMVQNEPGYSREGQPVYAEFNDTRHVATRRPIDPIQGLPLIIGADAGLTPAAVIKQRMPNGQWRALDEVVTEPGSGTGAKRFAEALSRLLAEARYRDFELDRIQGWADPSAAFGADRDAGEQDWIEIVSENSGIRFRPAPTNKLITRLEAVRQPMATTIDGTEPGYLMSTRCRVLRRAYNSGYRYRRVQVAGPAQYREEPEKNQYSHVADADQYAHIGGGEYHQVLGRKADRRGGRRQTRAIDDDNPGEWDGGGAGRQTTAME